MRSAEAGAAIDWRAGDAQALPGVADGAFDAVFSVFGAMYAPDQAAAARELARAVAPARRGGRIVLATGRPGASCPRWAVARAVPSAAARAGASAPPSRWGDPEAVGALLGGAGLESWRRRPSTSCSRCPTAMNAVAFLVSTAGNVLAERPRLEAEGRWGQLLAALGGVVAERDSGVGGRVALRCDYLLVEARRPAG